MLLNVIFGVHPLKTEQAGFLFSLIGAVMVVVDPLAKRVDDHKTMTWEFVRLSISSVFGAAYMIFNEKNTHQLRIMPLICFQSFQMFVLSSIFAVSFSEGKAMILSNDPQWGCFGFLSPNHFVDLFLLQGLVSGLCGGYGPTFCMMFHAPIVVHSSMLMIPFLAEGLAAGVWNIDQNMDFLQFFGALFAMIGLYKIHRGDR